MKNDAAVASGRILRMQKIELEFGNGTQSSHERNLNTS